MSATAEVRATVQLQQVGVKAQPCFSQGWNIGSHLPGDLLPSGCQIKIFGSPKEPEFKAP